MKSVLFYAPLKPPDHPTPSGDRRVARLLWQALIHGGYQPELTSALRAYSSSGGRAWYRALHAEADKEVTRLCRHYAHKDAAVRPKAWLTYHLYYKAPDLLGPRVCAALNLPYLIVEPSFAPKRATGPWQWSHQSCADAIAAADHLFCLNRLDMACVRPLVKGTARLVYMSPFIEPLRALPAQREKWIDRFGLQTNQHWLLAVGMFRHGDKLNSYERLAASLNELAGDDWQLLIIGDGPARAAVKALFEHIRFPDGSPKVHLLGEQNRTDIDAIMACCDLYVWPAVGEAFGMAFLEAGRQGLAVVAGHERGVPDIVLDGVTGLLVPPNEPQAFAAAIRRLLDEPFRRKRFGEAAKRIIASGRSVDMAAGKLASAITYAAENLPNP